MLAVVNLPLCPDDPVFRNASRADEYSPDEGYMIKALRSIKGKLILLMLLVVLLVTMLVGIGQNYSVSRHL